MEYTQHSTTSIKQVLYCDVFKTFLILFTDGNLCRYKERSSQDIYRCAFPVSAICFALKYKHFVTVCSDHKLRILDKDLSLINTIPYNTGT